MRDIDYNLVAEACLMILTHFIENFNQWLFYLVSYLFVWFFSGKIIQNIKKKVNITPNIKTESNIYVSIESGIKELRDSETKVFFAFVVAIFISFFLEKLIIPLKRNQVQEEYPIALLELVQFVILGIQYLLIYIFPNYSRFQTYQYLSKILK